MSDNFKASKPALDLKSFAMFLLKMISLDLWD